MVVAIDLAILAESIPRNWSFMLSGLACIWGLGNTLTGLIGKYLHHSHAGSAIYAADIHLQRGRCSLTSGARPVRRLRTATSQQTWAGDTCTLFLVACV